MYMRKLFVFCCLFYSQVLLAQQAGNERENPQVFERNKEKSRVAFMLYNNEQDARRDDYSKSPYYQPLEFSLVKTPAERPIDFYRTDLDDNTWGTIPVPSNWELQGCDLVSLHIDLKQRAQALQAVQLPGQAGKKEKLKCLSNEKTQLYFIPAAMGGRTVNGAAVEKKHLL